MSSDAETAFADMVHDRYAMDTQEPVHVTYSPHSFFRHPIWGWVVAAAVGLTCFPGLLIAELYMTYGHYHPETGLLSGLMGAIFAVVLFGAVGFKLSDILRGWYDASLHTIYQGKLYHGHRIHLDITGGDDRFRVTLRELEVRYPGYDLPRLLAPYDAAVAYDNRVRARAAREAEKRAAQTLSVEQQALAWREQKLERTREVVAKNAAAQEVQGA